ncbi:MAG: type II toxin-antitoxin system HipA family toxin [Gammaproteobacteria bacterium]
MSDNRASVLKLSLHGREVGHLIGFQNGRNRLHFSDSFRHDENRPTFSLITSPRFPKAAQLMAEPWLRMQRLHPTLSNLLPEGSMRELIAEGLKVHIDHEFHILSYLGADLPGALVIDPVAPDAVPNGILSSHDKIKAVKFQKITKGNKFSLAGIQMKFSMKEKDGRYNLSKENTLGDWIVKTPSTKHQDVPLNEYTAMTLASLASVNIPEIKLVELNKLDNLPQINLPDEKLAFAIKRFDRDGNTRIHMEDFAQVFVKYPHEKYRSVSYEQMGKVLYQYSGDGISDAQQFARRLLVNMLLANGDAHIKNWSLVYADRIIPRLSPAYDVVMTSAYIDDERHYALNLGKNKDWYKASYTNFEAWAVRSDIPWQAIKYHLDDTIEKARSLWPDALKNLPMNDSHKKKLHNHWEKLHSDFRIKF